MIIFLVLIFYVIIVITVVILNNSSRHKEKERTLRLEKEKALKKKSIPTTYNATPTTDDVTYVIDNKTNTIIRNENKPISDEEVPYLIELGYRQALERERQSKNVKFHRTEKEEDLFVQFMMNHGDEIDKRVDSFEKCNRLAFKEEDLDKKIELLQKTIIQFEKARTWFYRTKGGTIYFQDMYEHMHNSRDDDFSYISQVKDHLEECIRKRDYVIPKMLDVIKSSNGILQKDIYQHLPDVSKSEVQKVIRNFESEGLIKREKSKGSYLITFK